MPRNIIALRRRSFVNWLEPDIDLATWRRHFVVNSHFTFVDDLRPIVIGASMEQTIGRMNRQTPPAHAGYRVRRAIKDIESVADEQRTLNECTISKPIGDIERALIRDTLRLEFVRLLREFTVLDARSRIRTTHIHCAKPHMLNSEICWSACR